MRPLTGGGPSLITPASTAARARVEMRATLAR
jgi:hypothetical protein